MTNPYDPNVMYAQSILRANPGAIQRHPWEPVQIAPEAQQPTIPLPPKQPKIARQPRIPQLPSQPLQPVQNLPPEINSDDDASLRAARARGRYVGGLRGSPGFTL